MSKYYYNEDYFKKTKIGLALSKSGKIGEG